MRVASTVGLLVSVLGSGCGGSDVLLGGEFSGEDSAGLEVIAGDGEGYPEGETPAWPLRLRLLVEARERAGSEEHAVPLTSMTVVSLSATEGAACAQSGEARCAQLCSVGLEFTGPGSCAVRVRLDSTERPLEGCFVYTMSPSDTFVENSLVGHDLCPDEEPVASPQASPPAPCPGHLSDRPSSPHARLERGPFPARNQETWQEVTLWRFR